MARAGLSRIDIKRARDSLLAQGQHPSIDAIRIALGNTGSKTTIHRYLKELEEEEGAALNRAGSTSDAILDLVGRLAARLHEEAQAVVDQQIQDGVGGGAGPLERRAFLFFQFLQVAVDRRLRAGVTQRDTYRINRGVLSLGEQRIASTLNVKTTESGTGHGVRI